MPWLHSSGRDSNEYSEIMKSLEVTGVPHLILVSPDGTIAALGSDLRGEDLDRTLEKMLLGE